MGQRSGLKVQGGISLPPVNCGSIGPILVVVSTRDLGSLEQGIAGRVLIVITAIEDIATVVENRVIPMGHLVLRVFFPTPVFGAMKHHVVAPLSVGRVGIEAAGERRVFKAGVRLD
jgi:hypothetical protein